MLRYSLISIFGNHRRNIEYTSYQRGLVVEVIASRLTFNRIRKHYRISKSSTTRIVQNALVCYIDDSKSRSRRPKKLSIRNKRHILRIVRLNFKIIYKDLAKKADVSVLYDTLYRLLKEKNIIN